MPNAPASTFAIPIIFPKIATQFQYMDVALLLNESGWMTWTAAGILLLTFIIQSIYYIFIFSRFTSSSIPETSSETPPVSVILCGSP